MTTKISSINSSEASSAIRDIIDNGLKVKGNGSGRKTVYDVFGEELRKKPKGPPASKTMKGKGKEEEEKKESNHINNNTSTESIVGPSGSFPVPSIAITRASITSGISKKDNHDANKFSSLRTIGTNQRKVSISSIPQQVLRLPILSPSNPSLADSPTSIGSSETVKIDTTSPGTSPGAAPAV